MFRLEPLSHGALPGPSGARQHLVHDYHLSSSIVVLLVEITALQQLYPGRAQIARGDTAVIGEQAAGLFFGNFGRAVGAVPVRIIVEWKMGDSAHRFHSRERLEGCLPLLDETQLCGTISVTRVGKLDFECQ